MTDSIAEEIFDLYKRIHAVYPKFPDNASPNIILSEKFAEEAILVIDRSVDHKETEALLHSARLRTDGNHVLDYLSAINAHLVGELKRAEILFRSLIEKGYWLPYLTFFSLQRRSLEDFENWRDTELNSLISRYGKGQLYHLVQLRNFIWNKDPENAYSTLGELRNNSRWNPKVNASFLYTESWINMHRSAFEVALTTLVRCEKYIELECRPYFYEMKSLILENLGRVDEALEYLECYEAITLGFNRKEALFKYYLKRAHLLWKLERFEEALEFLDKYDHFGTEPEGSKTLRALCFHSMKKYDDVISTLENKTVLNKTDFQILGFAYREKGNCTSIEKLIKDFRSQNNELNEVLYRTLVLCYYYQEKTEEIKKMARSPKLREENYELSEWIKYFVREHL